MLRTLCGTHITIWEKHWIPERAAEKQSTGVCLRYIVGDRSANKYKNFSERSNAMSLPL